MYIHIYIYTHVCMHTHTHIYIYTGIDGSTRPSPGTIGCPECLLPCSIFTIPGEVPHLPSGPRSPDVPFQPFAPKPQAETQNPKPVRGLCSQSPKFGFSTTSKPHSALSCLSLRARIALLCSSRSLVLTGETLTIPTMTL